MLPGPAGQRSLGRNQAFLTPNRVFVEHGSREIPSDPIGLDPLAFQATAALNLRAHRWLLKYDDTVIYIDFAESYSQGSVESMNPRNSGYTVNTCPNVIVMPL